MSQFDPANFEGSDEGQTHVDDHGLDAAARLSMNKGATAPTYAIAGTPWIDDTASPWVLKIYDGADWIVVGTINSTTNTFQVLSSVDSDLLNSLASGNASGQIPINNGILNVNLNAEQHNGIRTKIIEIGDWDMDTTQAVLIAHGVTPANIRRVSAMIRRDDSLRMTEVGADASGDLYIQLIDLTNVNLFRKTGGIFDGDPNYNATGFNRGWIVIDYV